MVEEPELQVEQVVQVVVHLFQQQQLEELHHRDVKEMPVEHRVQLLMDMQEVVVENVQQDQQDQLDQVQVVELVVQV